MGGAADVARAAEAPEAVVDVAEPRGPDRGRRDVELVGRAAAGALVRPALTPPMQPPYTRPTAIQWQAGRCGAAESTWKGAAP